MAVKKPAKVPCAGPTCRKSFVPKNTRQKFCSTTCRVAASRRPAEKTSAARKATEAAGRSFERATRAELVKLKELDSLRGQQLMFLAARMSDPAETGSSIASLSKEHSRLMDELRAGKPKGDFVDEVRERRDRIAREAQAQS